MKHKQSVEANLPKICRQISSGKIGEIKHKFSFFFPSFALAGHYSLFLHVVPSQSFKHLRKIPF